MSVGPLDPALLLAFASVLIAAMQLILARRRDLGPFTVGLAGAALALGGGQRAVVGAAAVAAALAALAWLRGGRAGVGRPGLVGVTLAAAVVGVGAPILAPHLDAARLSAAGAAFTGTVALGAGLAALERPSTRRRVVRWVGRIPIDVPRSGA